MTQPASSPPLHLHPPSSPCPSAPEADSFRKPQATSKGKDDRAKGTTRVTSAGAPESRWGARAEPSLGGADCGEQPCACGNPPSPMLSQAGGWPGHVCLHPSSSKDAGFLRHGSGAAAVSLWGGGGGKVFPPRRPLPIRSSLLTKRHAASLSPGMEYAFVRIDFPCSHTPEKETERTHFSPSLCGCRRPRLRPRAVSLPQLGLPPHDSLPLSLSVHVLRARCTRACARCGPQTPLRPLLPASFGSLERSL